MSTQALAVYYLEQPPTPTMLAHVRTGCATQAPAVIAWNPRSISKAAGGLEPAGTEAGRSDGRRATTPSPPSWPCSSLPPCAALARKRFYLDSNLDCDLDFGLDLNLDRIPPLLLLATSK